jgi:peptidoglycan/LPS O-acetylase OafA/YrhL
MTARSSDYSSARRLLAAYLSHRYFEAPAQRLIRELLLRPSEVREIAPGIAR